MKKQNKGFAYMKESERYKVVFGDSEKEILDTLQKWNATRGEEQRYVYCNIGTLDTEMDKYIRYQKYDVATGRNISSLWLTIPGMSKDEFKQTIQEFKEMGARYHSVQKKWYVSPDNPNMDYFKNYVEGAEKEREKIVRPEALENKVPVSESKEEQNATGYHSELVTQFQKVAEADSRQMKISEEKLALLEELVAKDVQISGKVSNLTSQILDTYGAEIRSLDTGNGRPWVEYKQPEVATTAPAEVTIDKEDYLISISKDTEDNRVTIYYKDGRLPVDLRGDQFNVHFPSSSEAHVLEVVQGYFEAQVREYPEAPATYEVGDSIDVFKGKEMTIRENPEQVLVAGLERIQGVVESVEVDTDHIYCVKDAGGLYSYVSQGEIYSAHQVEVLQRAIKDELPPEKFHIVANPELGSAQMEELRFAFKDGFSTEQVQEIATVAKNSWQISLYRYGMQHGIELKEIQGICANESKRWIECHQEVDTLIRHRRQERIRDLTKQGFRADVGVIKKLETIDHLTGRKNSLKDVCTAFKQGTYEQTPAGAVIKSLGRELQAQELQLQQTAMEPEP